MADPPSSNAHDPNRVQISVGRKTATWVAAVLAAVIIACVAFVAGRQFGLHEASRSSAASTSPPSSPASTPTTTAPVPTTAAPPTTTAANRAILPPATTSPAVVECSEQLSFAADGSYGPLSCANGTQVNVLAWDAAAKSNSLVLSLGPNATPSQVQTALCADVKDQTIPIETGIYQLAALYYGWNFAYDPSQTLSDGTC